MGNIKFNYLYRDAGNYKIYGGQIFSNPEDLILNEIESKIRYSLIEGEFFNPIKWDLKTLRFDDWNTDSDHGWNEFESIEVTNEPSTTAMTIKEFLEKIQSFESSARF